MYRQISRRRGVGIIFCLVLRISTPPVFASDRLRRGRPGNVATSEQRRWHQWMSIRHCRQRKAWAKGRCVFGGNSRSVTVCHRSVAIVVLWLLSPPIFSVSIATAFCESYTVQYSVLLFLYLLTCIFECFALFTFSTTGLGKCRILWGKREQAMHCMQHWTVDHVALRLSQGGRVCESLLRETKLYQWNIRP